MGDLRIGLVGCGRIAERGYVPAASRARDVVLAAVADRVAERCASVAPGVPAFPDAASLLDAGLVHAIVLATPVAGRLDDARLASSAGVPALVEKPPAQDADEARALAELDPQPWIGFNRRFEPGVEKLRAALPLAGQLEIVVELICPRSGWPAHEVRDELLLDLAPHAIDLARYLAGADPARVRAAGDGRAAELELDLRLGRRAVLRLAHVGRYRELLAVRGPDGRVARLRKGGLLAVPGRLPLVHSLARQLEALAAAVAGSPPPALGTAADAVAVMAAVDAARDSLAAGGAWRPVAASALAAAR